MCRQDDKKSSIASESRNEEAGGRRDSFESEDLAVEPMENQSVYAKSNLVKEQILRKGSRTGLGPPGRLCRQCSLSQQSLKVQDRKDI